MLSAFVAAFVSTMLAGTVAYFIFKHFASDQAAGIAALWLTVGAAGGRYSYAGPLTREAAFGLTAFAGAVLAILLLWRWLRRQPTNRATGGDF
jgi:hypothetical protein